MNKIDCSDPKNDIHKFLLENNLCYRVIACKKIVEIYDPNTGFNFFVDISIPKYKPLVIYNIIKLINKIKNIKIKEK